MLTQLSPGISRFMLPMNKSGGATSSCYLLSDSGQWLLIDCGRHLEQNTAALASLVKELSIPWERLAVFITHAHTDHYGQLGLLCGRCRDLYISKPDYIIMNASWDLDYWYRVEENFVRRGWPADRDPGFALRNFSPKPAGIDGMSLHLVGEGDTVPVGGKTLRCLLTPGHTPGHTALLQDDGTLFCGDLVMDSVRANLYVRQITGNSVWQMLDSLRRPEVSGAVRLLPGHGNEITDPAAASARAAAYYERLVSTVLALVTRERQTAFEISKRFLEVNNRWGSSSDAHRWFVLGDILAVLEGLCQHSVIKLEADADSFIYTLL